MMRGLGPRRPGSNPGSPIVINDKEENRGGPPKDGDEHVDSSILIELLFKQSQASKARELINRSRYRKNPKLGISTIALGEVVKSIAYADASEQLKIEMCKDLLEWLKEGAVVIHTHEDMHEFVEDLQDEDYRLKHPDASILACALFSEARKIYSLDEHFKNIKTEKYCKDKGLKINLL